MRDPRPVRATMPVERRQAGRRAGSRAGARPRGKARPWWPVAGREAPRDARLQDRRGSSPGGNDRARSGDRRPGGDADRRLWRRTLRARAAPPVARAGRARRQAGPMHPRSRRTALDGGAACRSPARSDRHSRSRGRRRTRRPPASRSGGSRRDAAVGDRGGRAPCTSTPCRRRRGSITSKRTRARSSPPIRSSPARSIAPFGSPSAISKRSPSPFARRRDDRQRRTRRGPRRPHVVGGGMGSRRGGPCRMDGPSSGGKPLRGLRASLRRVCGGVWKTREVPHGGSCCRIAARRGSSRCAATLVAHAARAGRARAAKRGSHGLLALAGGGRGVGASRTDGTWRSLLVARAPFVTAVAVMFAGAAWAGGRSDCSARVAHAVATRPRPMALAGLVFSCAAWGADAFVLPRLYPAFHLALFALTLGAAALVAVALRPMQGSARRRRRSSRLAALVLGARPCRSPTRRRRPASSRPPTICD